MTREEAIKLIEDDKKRHHDELSGRYRQALTMAIDALQADRPRGKWIKATEATWQCSLCNGIMYVESNYCPFCGAKMEGERK